MATDPTNLRQRLALARLYVLIDGRSSPDALAALARSLITAGVDMLQLRDKTLDDRRLLDRARLLRDLTLAANTLLIINDRLDIALLAKADGVHVGQDDLDIEDVCALAGPNFLAGVSTHSLEQSRQAARGGADYIGCGPTFASETKQFVHFPGIEFLRAVSREISLPAFAIGGISERNAPQVLEAGFHRIAVSAAVVEAADPATNARRLRNTLQESGKPPC